MRWSSGCRGSNVNLVVTAQEGLKGLAPGEVIGARYELVAELAHGGMGRVFSAVDTQLRRKVAIKLISWPIASTNARKRFWQEALAFITREGRAKLIDFGIAKVLALVETLSIDATPPTATAEGRVVGDRRIHGARAAAQRVWSAPVAVD